MRKTFFCEMVRAVSLFCFCAILTCCIGGYSAYAGEDYEGAEAMYIAMLKEKLFDETDNSEDPAEGYDVLNGLWKVGAIDYDFNNNPARNLVVDVNDSDALSDLYDSLYLSFFADGTFVYADVYFHEGTYTAHPKNPGCYILKTDSSYRMTVEDGEVVKLEDSSKPSYYLEVCDDSLHLQDYDPFTGKAKANDNGYYFVRIEDESSFIQNNKAELQFKDPQEESSGADHYASLSTYAGILETYTNKMKAAVPGLVSEYENESAGISDITRLAEICNDKVEDLAELCNEGVGKMAELMYDNNDSYDTYSNWSEKLMNNYIEIAQEIQDAYINSAM